MDTPAIYHITVAEHLGETVLGLLPDLHASCDATGHTILTGTLPDQAALNGILNQLHGLGLTVLSLMSEKVDES